MLRRIASTLLLGLALLTPVSAQETLEIPNWPAPPFWSAPVKWEKGAQATPMSVEGSGPVATPFIAIPPCRIADTRGNGFTGQAGPPTVLANVPRTFQVGGTIPGVLNQCGIAPTAIAVSFQFTVTNMTSAGNLIAWPSGPPPTTSVLNWNANSVAIGSGTVVQIGGGISGSLNVQINAPIGQAADLIIDVNGYYLFGGLDSFYVNENQLNSVTSSMIEDGTIINSDINASAGIADSKLATIATAGKVADSALSANVTKLGSSIEAGEITDVVGSISIPLTSFTDCGSVAGALLDFNSGADAVPDFSKVAAAEGQQLEIRFDAVAVTPDQNYEICSQFVLPPDYVSGGTFRVLASMTAPPTGTAEVFNCFASKQSQGAGTPGTAAITNQVATFYTCDPGLTSVTAGDAIDFYFTITAAADMDNTIGLAAVEFRYVASQ